MFYDWMIVLLFLKGKYCVWSLVYEFHRRHEIVLCSAEEISITSAHIIVKLSNFFSYCLDFPFISVPSVIPLQKYSL